MRARLTLTILSLFFIAFTLSCKDEEKPNRLKIGMFVVGDGYYDSGYKQNCKEGILLALKEISFDTLFTSSLTNLQEGIDYYPQNDFDVLFLAGSIASEQLLNSAAKYPKTQFVIVDYNYEGALQNVQSINYNSNEAAFPLGFLAAFWAAYKDDVNPAIGIIGGMDIPVIERFMTAYNLGVNYFNKKYSKNVKVVSSFLNTFDDTDYGYHIADSLINNCSADVIIPVAGNAGNGSLLAAKENHKWAIGVDADQFYSLPDVSDILLSSCMKSLESTIYIVTTSFIKNPEINNATYTGTLKNQGVSMAPYHNYETQIPDSIKADIETIKTGIIKGNIDTGF